jgi:hypothetical protein
MMTASERECSEQLPTLNDLRTLSFDVFRRNKL